MINTLKTNIASYSSGKETSVTEYFENLSSQLSVFCTEQQSKESDYFKAFLRECKLNFVEEISDNYSHVRELEKLYKPTYKFSQINNAFTIINYALNDKDGLRQCQEDVLAALSWEETITEIQSAVLSRLIFKEIHELLYAEKEKLEEGLTKPIKQYAFLGNTMLRIEDILKNTSFKFIQQIAGQFEQLAFTFNVKPIMPTCYNPMVFTMVNNTTSTNEKFEKQICELESKNDDEAKLEAQTKRCIALLSNNCKAISKEIDTFVEKYKNNKELFFLAGFYETLFSLLSNLDQLKFSRECIEELSIILKSTQRTEKPKKENDGQEESEGELIMPDDWSPSMIKKAKSLNISADASWDDDDETPSLVKDFAKLTTNESQNDLLTAPIMFTPSFDETKVDQKPTITNDANIAEIDDNTKGKPKTASVFSK